MMDDTRRLISTDNFELYYEKLCTSLSLRTAAHCRPLCFDAVRVNQKTLLRRLLCSLSTLNSMINVLAWYCSVQQAEAHLCSVGDMEGGEASFI